MEPGLATTSTLHFYLAYTYWESGLQDLTKLQEASFQKSITHIATNIHSFHHRNCLHVNIGSLLQLQLNVYIRKQTALKLELEKQLFALQERFPKAFLVSFLLCHLLGFFFIFYYFFFICQPPWSVSGVLPNWAWFTSQLLWCCADMHKCKFEIGQWQIRTSTISSGCCLFWSNLLV